jgi:hypothetical protein
LKIRATEGLDSCVPGTAWRAAVDLPRILTRNLHSPLTRPLSAKGMKTKLFFLTKLVSIRYKYCRKSAQTGVQINTRSAR